MVETRRRGNDSNGRVMMETEVGILLLLFIKHFVCDFPLQVPYMYLNKGTYGHRGGIDHALVHGLGTWGILVPFGFTGFFLGLFDAVIHYHIDWTKMNINSYFDLKPDNSEYFWWLLGADQLAHALTYFFLVWILFP